MSTKDDTVRMQTPGSSHLRAGSRCVKGNYRVKNEDKCYANAEEGIFVVADGIGGHPGGQQASSFVIQAVPSMVAPVMANSLPDHKTIRGAIRRGVVLAREQMRLFAARHPAYAKMGSTMALVAIKDKTAYICSIGDCRVYLLRKDKLHRLTKDQNLAQHLQDEGLITSSEAQTSNYRHLLTNHIGVRKRVSTLEVDVCPLADGDRLLLATDGLTCVLDDEKITEMLQSGTPKESADQLVLEALRRDSHDNISCVVVKVVPSSVHPAEEPQKKGESPLRYRHQQIELG